MPKYTNNKDSIDLNDYQRVRELTNGRTNSVFLWEHKEDPNLKIVVKTPLMAPADVIRHNIKSINAFFGKDSAWQVDGEQAFAMKYFEGTPLTEEDMDNDDFLNTIKTIRRNHIQFTMIDYNQDNFLRLATGEIIPIDHDLLILHDNTDLLGYQKFRLDYRRGYMSRMSDGQCSIDQQVQYVLDSYPQAFDYLYQKWGSEYVSDRALLTFPQIKDAEQPSLASSTPLMEPNISSASSIIEPNIEHFSPAPEPFLIDPSVTLKFTEQLKSIHRKALKLQDDGHALAAQAAFGLHRNLDTAFVGYVNQQVSPAEFKKSCNDSIVAARPILEQHRGWKEILYNIALAIAGLVVGYVAAGFYNLITTRGQHFFFKCRTDSAKQIDTMENIVEQVVPN